MAKKCIPDKILATPMGQNAEYVGYRNRIFYNASRRIKLKTTAVYSTQEINKNNTRPRKELRLASEDVTVVLMFVVVLLVAVLVVLLLAVVVVVDDIPAAGES